MLFDPSKARIVPASEVAKHEVNPEDFLLRPWFLARRGRLILGAKTEAGKSWVCLNIVRALVLGESLFGNPDWPTRKSSVLLLESEVGITLPKRIKLVFEDQDLDSLENFHILRRPEGFNLSYSQCCDWLQAQIKERSFDVVVIDPIGDLSTVDENSNSDVNRLIHALQDMQGEAALIYSHHFGKDPKGEYKKDFDPLSIDNFRGASKFGDGVDAALTMVRRPGRINPEYESWINDARWEKTRHSDDKPPQGTLRFNEIGNGRMYWRYEATTKSSSKVVSIASGEKPDTPWS